MNSRLRQDSATDSSKVVAAVRGMAKTTQRHKIATVVRIVPPIFPSVSSKAPRGPPKRLTTNTPRHERTASTSRNPTNPHAQRSPLSCPKVGGNIKLPAPKNIAKSENPTTIESFPSVDFSFVLPICLMLDPSVQAVGCLGLLNVLNSFDSRTSNNQLRRR